MLDDFARSFGAFANVYYCGRAATFDGFAALASARLQQHRAGVTLRSASAIDCAVLAGEIGETVAALTSRITAGSTATVAIDRDGRIICMFGVMPVGFLSDAGVPWLVVSPLLKVHWRLAARLSRRYLIEMLELYPWLTGTVEAGDHRAIRHLEWLGFFVGSRLATGDGNPLRPFNKRK